MNKKLLNLVAAVTLLFFSNVTLAQAPDLGEAANFVLYTTTGAVSNNGISFQTLLTGNVGTNGGGAITGFGNVNGGIHINDDTTHRAANDLLVAYNQLIGTTPATNLAPGLGGGDTLRAGTYSIAGSSTLTDTLTLDGELHPDAIFIFNIQSAFTANSAYVRLINGAQACNVFWTTGALVSLNSGSNFKGTIIANNAAIVINTDVVLEGRALSTTGAISVNKIQASIPTGCGRAQLTGPIAPDLVSTACYAIFTSSGVVTGDPVSQVTGDIGTNAGATAGFDPLNVSGTVHYIPDNSTTKCALDLLNVRDYLDNLTPDIELLRPVEFGNKLVLTPHTYILRSATTLTDTLFLDAQNNPNAVFVIVSTGAFATTSGAAVSLINGTQAGNVYWRITGEVDLEPNTDFKGTIIVTGGAISIKTGARLVGRALTTSGAFSTAAVNVTIPSACTSLPVSWLYFQGKPVGNGVLLEWATASERNNGFFTIEKSRDGNAFETLTTVKARQQTTQAENHYSFTDLQPYSVGYYRLSQSDIDGQKSFYRTIQVKSDINQSLKATHYVQGNFIYVQTSGATAGNGSIQLYSIDGKKMSSQNIMLTKEPATYKVEKPSHTGLYLLYIESHGERLYHGKVLVQ